MWGVMLQSGTLLCPTRLILQVCIQSNRSSPVTSDRYSHEDEKKVLVSAMVEEGVQAGCLCLQSAGQPLSTPTGILLKPASF